jgi:isomaltose glucohydrolase
MTVATTSLARRSIEVILAGQTAHGAYLAPRPSRPTATAGSATAPSSPTPWTSGASSTARRAFHAWVRACSSRTRRSRPSPADPTPAARAAHALPPDGTPGSEDWPNFQLDGFGTWLWAYGAHVRRTGQDADADDGAVVRGRGRLPLALCGRAQLRLLGGAPGACPSSTLAAIFAGLRRLLRLLDDRYYLGAAERRAFVPARPPDRRARALHQARRQRRRRRQPAVGPCRTAWCCRPDHRVVTATVAKVRRDLLDPDGGVHRYAARHLLRRRLLDRS